MATPLLKALERERKALLRALDDLRDRVDAFGEKIEAAGAEPAPKGKGKPKAKPKPEVDDDEEDDEEDDEGDDDDL